MKDINKKKLPELDIVALLEYILAKQPKNTLKALKSLGNPLTAHEAINNTKKILLKSKKFLAYIPLKDDILAKIVYEALTANRPITDQISLFVQQKASDIAATKVGTGMVVANVANGAYQAIHKAA